MARGVQLEVDKRRRFVQTFGKPFWFEPQHSICRCIFIEPRFPESQITRALSDHRQWASLLYVTMSFSPPCVSLLQCGRLQQKKNLRKIKAVIHHYLGQATSKHRTMINWRECCMKIKFGGFGLVDPKAATIILLRKRVIEAMEPGESNLQLMLRFKVVRFNSTKG